MLDHIHVLVAMLTYHPRIKRCEYSVSFGFVVSFVVLFVWKQRLRSPAREVHGMRPHVASETLVVRSLWKTTFFGKIYEHLLHWNARIYFIHDNIVKSTSGLQVLLGLDLDLKVAILWTQLVKQIWHKFNEIEWNRNPFCWVDSCSWMWHMTSWKTHSA